MLLPENDYRCIVDYSKIPEDLHDYAREYVFAREAAPFYAASLRLAGERRRNAQNSVGAIMEADIEYVIAQAENEMNKNVIMDDRAGIVSNAVVNDPLNSHSWNLGE